jgi:tetratricopeptide (TPR) repeat protein
VDGFDGLRQTITTLLDPAGPLARRAGEGIDAVRTLMPPENGNVLLAAGIGAALLLAFLVRSRATPAATSAPPAPRAEREPPPPAADPILAPRQRGPEVRVRAEAVVTALIAALRRRRDDGEAGDTASRAAARQALERAAALEDHNRQLTLAVSVLITAGLERRDIAPGVEAALTALEQGEAGPAQAIFRDALTRAGTAAPEARLAAVWRHLGALTELSNADQALEAYQRALELEATSAEAWGQIGVLRLRQGDLASAETACAKAMALARGPQQRGLLAGVAVTLSQVHKARGALDRAEEYLRIALTYQASLSRRPAMARAYAQLGQLHQARSDWPKAEEEYRKALALEQALGQHEGMAEAETQLGAIAKTRGDLFRARDHWHHAARLYREANMPQMARLVDGMVTAAGGTPGAPAGPP